MADGRPRAAPARARCFIALGLFVSTLTSNQIVAGILTFGLLARLLDPRLDRRARRRAPVTKVVAYLGVTTHMEDLMKGVHRPEGRRLLPELHHASASSWPTSRWRASGGGPEQAVEAHRLPRAPRPRRDRGRARRGRRPGRILPGGRATVPDGRRCRSSSLHVAPALGGHRRAASARRQMRYGTQHACARRWCVLGILVRRQLPGRPATRKHWDLTKNQRYSLSDQTKKVVQGLKDDVHDHLLPARGGDGRAARTG